MPLNYDSVPAFATLDGASTGSRQGSEFDFPTNALESLIRFIVLPTGSWVAPAIPKVVVVSGLPGAGKSALIARIAEIMAPSAAVTIDRSLSAEFEPGALVRWLDAGGDPEEWRTPGLVDALRVLRGESGRTGTANLILVEEPFGRARSEIADLVDLSVHLKAQPDVALARTLVEALADQSGVADVGSKIAGYLQNYLDRYADLYRSMDSAAASSAHLVLNATESPERNARRVIDAIERNDGPTAPEQPLGPEEHGLSYEQALARALKIAADHEGKHAFLTPVGPWEAQKVARALEMMGYIVELDAEDSGLLVRKP